MYLADTELTITWPLDNVTGGVIVQSALNVVVTDSDGATTYYDGATTGWVEPTATSIGSVSYVVTPATTGTWLVRLVTGVSSDYVVVSECRFTVQNVSDGNPSGVGTTSSKVLSTNVYAPVSAANYGV